MKGRCKAALAFLAAGVLVPVCLSGEEVNAREADIPGIPRIGISYQRTSISALMGQGGTGPAGGGESDLGKLVYVEPGDTHINVFRDNIIRPRKEKE